MCEVPNYSQFVAKKFFEKKTIKANNINILGQYFSGKTGKIGSSWFAVGKK